MDYIGPPTILTCSALYALWWAWHRSRRTWRQERRAMHSALADILSDRER
jgi:hypothetical protein